MQQPPDILNQGSVQGDSHEFRMNRFQIYLLNHLHSLYGSIIPRLWANDRYYPCKQEVFGIPWFRQIQQGSFRSDEGFDVAGSGGWAQLGQTRVQLPAVAVEVVPARSLEGYQLGGGQWVNTDVVFHVITANHWECANLVDSILYQNDRSIDLFNPTTVAISGVSPFNYRNELTENAIPSGLYPNLVANFHYKGCWINSSRGGDITQLSPELYIGSARCSTQVKAI